MAFQREYHDSLKDMNSGFVIPKTTPTDVILRNLPLDSRDAQEMISDLCSHKGSHTFDLRIAEISSIESVCNSKFLKPFSDRRAEMRDDGSTVRECYAFTIIPSHEIIENALLQTKIDISLIDSSGMSLVLGDPNMGIHIFKSAEAALLHYGQAKQFLTFSLILMKVILAKGNIVKAQPSCGGCLLEPQPNYDHHITRDTDNDANQLLYVFEYNSEAEIVQSPRSILPVALFNYELVNGVFKRSTSNQNYSHNINVKRNKNDSQRVAAIIRMKKEQALAAAAAEEARCLEAERRLRMKENSSRIEAPLTSLVQETQQHKITKHDTANVVIIEDVDMEDVVEVRDENNHTTLPRFRGPSLIPLCADIINQCGYDPTKLLEDNRQALALSNGSGVVFNPKTLQSLRRSGRAYCKEKKSSEMNSLVQICRQLPQESQLSAAFHLVIGFLRYQLGDSSVQIKMSSINSQDSRSNQCQKTDAEIQCDLTPEICILEGPDSSTCQKQSAIVTSSVMIQCNLNKISSNKKYMNTIRGFNSSLNHDSTTADTFQQSKIDQHPSKPIWGRQTAALQDRKSPFAISTKLPMKVLDEHQHESRNDADEKEENDERFVLRLITEAMINEEKKRPSNAMLNRIEAAIYKYLNRSDEVADRDHNLLDLANHAQQGRWQTCLSILGVPITSVRENVELVTRSKHAGQMWAQALTSSQNHDHSMSSECLSSFTPRKISRYSDDIFEDTVSTCDIDRAALAQSPSALQATSSLSIPSYKQRRSFIATANTANHNKNPMFSSQLSAMPTIPTITSPLRPNRHQLTNDKNLSIMHLRNVLFQRKSTDLANMLRLVNTSRQCNRIDELALYSHLLNLRKSHPP
ncbi:hypothetical protein GJ496_002089 [Pomphorhynchus laevis]|nr:hypothetical protein GJ496_002089 [Pomphorhynchus laevis]